MALSAEVVYNTRERGIEAYPITTGEVFYHGALVGLGASGTAITLEDSASVDFLGICDRSHPLTTYGISTIVDEVPVNVSGPILERVTVSGTSAITDVGGAVYMNLTGLDDASLLSTSATSNLKSIGRIVRWHTGNTCDVRLFTPAEYLTLA
jgi:hypothetical protein